MTTHSSDIHPAESNPAVSAHVAVLTKSMAEVQAHIGRADTKASILAGLALAALAGGTGAAGQAHLHGVAVAGAVLTAALIGAALLLRGTAIRPALGGNYGFMRWASAPTATTVHHYLSHADPVTDGERHLWLMARSAHLKYRRIRHAVDLLGLALAAAALTALLAGLGW